MKKLIVLCGIAVLMAAALSVAANSQTTPPKTWICHKADSSHWVALRTAKSLVKGHLRHGDMVVPAASQNRTAARAFCATLPLITATRGGSRLDATLAPTGGNTVGTGSVVVRASVGQQRVCWTLTVNLTPAQLATTGNVVAAHIHGPLPATGILVGFTLTPATLATLNTALAAAGTATTTGCETNVPRATIKQILQNPGSFFVNVHTGTFPNGALQGTLSR